MLLSVATAALSCSKEMPYNPDNESPYTIVVTGTASDKSDGTPLQEIKITLYAAEQAYGEDISIRTTEANTDSNGHYTLTMDGFKEPVSCTVAASDPKNIYSTTQQELRISWSGTSFDEYTGYFYVNDCDFYMEKMLSAKGYSDPACPSDSLHCFGEHPTILTN